MDVLKRVLAVMVALLVILVGAGLYLSTTMKHGTMNMETPKTTPETTKQTVNVILQPDLRNYIDEINKGIILINEANGLITSDSFFAEPPKVPKGKLDTTPFDKLIPKDRDTPILVMPDGTYQVIDNSGLDMRDVHRGIYKLGQGMTVLNSVLDRMNDDIKNNNFPLKSSTQNTGITNMSGMNMPSTTSNANMPNTGGTMPNMSMGGTGTGLLSSLSLTNIMYIFLIGFLILGIVSIIGFVASLFRPKAVNNPEND